MNSNRPLPVLDQFEAYRPSAAAFKAAQRRREAPPETLSPTQVSTSWICALIAAGIMMETLFFKFSGAAESRYIFSKMGTDPYMRWTQGVWELLAALGLLIPGWHWLGGILTLGDMGAAIISHMTWLGYAALGDHELLLGMALTTFTCGFTIVVLHRHQILFVAPWSYG